MNKLTKESITKESIIQCLYSDLGNRIPGVQNDSVLSVVRKITEKTTPEDFKALIHEQSDFDFKQYAKKVHGNWDSDLSVIHKAVRVGNLKLLEFMITKFGKDCLNLLDSCSKTPLHTAARERWNLQSNTILQLLINNGASVNLPTLTFGYMPRTALDIALESQDLTKIKILLRAGAQQSCSLTDVAFNILQKKIEFPVDFNIDSAIFIKKTLESSTFKNRSSESLIDQAMKEIFAEKFLFFLGIKNPNSIVSTLPKEIVAKILTDPKYPCIREKAKQMLMNAKNGIFNF
jgi:hypothetical protein